MLSAEVRTVIHYGKHRDSYGHRRGTCGHVLDDNLECHVSWCHRSTKALQQKRTLLSSLMVESRLPTGAMPDGDQAVFKYREAASKLRSVLDSHCNGGADPDPDDVHAYREAARKLGQVLDSRVGDCNDLSAHLPALRYRFPSWDEQVRDAVVLEQILPEVALVELDKRTRLKAIRSFSDNVEAHAKGDHEAFVWMDTGDLQELLNTVGVVSQRRDSLRGPLTKRNWKRTMFNFFFVTSPGCPKFLYEIVGDFGCTAAPLTVTAVHYASVRWLYDLVGREPAFGFYGLLGELWLDQLFAAGTLCRIDEWDRRVRARR